MSRPQPHSPGSPLSFPVAEAPQPGSVTEIAPGILWIRLALPFRLDHINVWALDGGAEGRTLVDTGLTDSRTMAAWEEILAGPLAGRPIRRIVATHFHPDHLGLAGWLVDRSGAEFALSLTEWLYASMLSSGGNPTANAAIDTFYLRAGLDAETRESLLQRRNAYSRAVPSVPGVMTRLRHGSRVAVGSTSWEVIVGAGHSAEPVSLFDRTGNVLISGDQVLPSISPNVSVWPSEPEADPLNDFLESFATLAHLPDDVLVLPSHGLPFRGLHGRLADLRAHHEERLTEIVEICAEDRTAAQVSSRLFRRDLDAQQMVFAMGETLAHLNYLLHRGGLTRRLGLDGVHLYRRAG